jgi:hypothetical protein
LLKPYLPGTAIGGDAGLPFMLCLRW